MHQRAHWIGRPASLNRDLHYRFGSSAFAMEEFRPELASAFVTNELDIQIDISQPASILLSESRVKSSALPPTSSLLDPGSPATSVD